jgi:hypothetical protein
MNFLRRITVFLTATLLFSSVAHLPAFGIELGPSQPVVLSGPVAVAILLATRELTTSDSASLDDLRAYSVSITAASSHSYHVRFGKPDDATWHVEFEVQTQSGAVRRLENVTVNQVGEQVMGGNSVVAFLLAEAAWESSAPSTLALASGGVTIAQPFSVSPQTFWVHFMMSRTAGNLPSGGFLLRCDPPGYTINVITRKVGTLQPIC